MSKTVLELQVAFQAIVNKLKRNKNVLAILTFGSIVSGDIWEGSDIDLFVIYKDDFHDLRGVFYKSKGVEVHAKMISKDSFIKLYETDGKRGYARNLLAKSKLIFCRDEKLTELYNKSRYSHNPYKDRWNLYHLGNILKYLGVCKKYYETGGILTSYEVLIRVFDSISRLFINIREYESTKDALCMACNLDKEINESVNNLINSKVDNKIIKKTINFVEKFINENIIVASEFLVEYLRNKDKELSSYEINKDPLFKDFNINLEEILKALTTVGLVQKNKRMLMDSEGNRIMYEYVYSAKNI